MDLKIKLYSDGAVLADMLKMKEMGLVTGFTTNPSLMKRAGITDYVQFAREVLKEIPDMPISFEVFADDFETMEKEADKIAALGDNVYVKIPIINTKGESAGPLIRRLSEKGIKQNITAITLEEQVKVAVDSFVEGTKNIVSVFAGRIADTGVDPIPLMKKSVELCNSKEGTELLWASTREVFNIIEADRLDVAIITVPPGILEKLSNMYQMDLYDLSLETVKTFNKDIKDLGFTILD